jgi:glyoxylase-like metal-dependent hydrolase (beta-lactamase superfamily II)
MPPPGLSRVKRSMKIHHFSAGEMQPLGGALFDGRTPGMGPAHFICHCLLLETAWGPILIDAGVVGQDTERSAALIGPLFLNAFNIRLRSNESAAAQITRLGHQVGDVKHVIMTHMDFDHVGGLPDFPNATIHLSRLEARAVRAPSGLKERARYGVANAVSQSNWHVYDHFNAEFFGLPATYLDDVPGLMLVALPGHTKGHCGVAIDLGRGQWMLHAGDAILNARELAPVHPSMPTGARLLQWSMESSQRQRRRSLASLRRIRRDQGHHVEIICTHDPYLLATSTPEIPDKPGRVVIGG